MTELDLPYHDQRRFKGDVKLLIASDEASLAPDLTVRPAAMETSDKLTGVAD